ncbi:MULTISPECIES: response regulator [Shewanella]|uniref:Response regulator n=1 Tax=Shewanella marisflavi TaxID=260364 RepID=A0ABX5WIN3_9GAMM|nr:MULTISPECIES: response regulator [Shewanella]QDF74265.1 response regulator [Shewanella marisflavi]
MSRAKILIIDDDPVCTGVLLAMLGDDYDVTSANSGIGGIEVLKSLTPDLILLDITMPHVNGYQVIQHLKGDEQTASIPVVVISSLTEQSDKAFALKLGVDGYITKPIMPDAIQEVIEDYL